MFEVQNQPPPLEPYNLFLSDRALREAVGREAAGWADGELSALGATLGKPETIQLGFDANKFTPQLRTLDRYGHRIDEVEFHPAWHELLELASEGWSAFKPLGGSEIWRPRGARSRHLHARANRKRGLLPDRDDLWFGADASPRTRDCRGVVATDLFARLRPPFSSGAAQECRADRHGHDRKPGRL